MVALGALLLGACIHYQSPPRIPISGPTQVDATPVRVGQTWSYRLINGYNGEVVREYREQLVEASPSELRIERRTGAGDLLLTERYTPSWHWIEVERPGFWLSAYTPPLVALPFPLEIGKTWTAYTTTSDPQTGRSVRVRVDGRVVRWEKVTLPGGVFDTVLVRRMVYIGDGDFWRSDREIYESDWYAPALGRVVRSENTSGYFDLAQTSRAGALWIRGDWNIVELTASQTGSGTP